MSNALKLLDDMINELTLLVEEPSIVVAPETDTKVTPAHNESKESNVNKKDKKEKKATAAVTSVSEPADTVININSVDLRVGIIRKVTKHETAGIYLRGIIYLIIIHVWHFTHQLYIHR